MDHSENKELVKEMASMKVAEVMRQINAPKDQKDFKFWNTQPVTRLDETPTEAGPISPELTRMEIRPDPYPLPAGYQWSTMDLQDEKQMDELYELLKGHYVEDVLATFSFQYSKLLLKWALCPPGYKQVWHVGLRNAEGSLLACIHGTPLTMKVYTKDISMVLINFLCVHKSLRSKRLAPVLIKEVTRRVHLEGLFQAVYTSGTRLPKPVSSCQYFHRSINVKKLVETGFSFVKKKMTLARTIKLQRVDTSYKLQGYRQIEGKDMEQAFDIYCKEVVANSDLGHAMVLEEFKHYMTPIDNAVASFVVVREGQILAFASYFVLQNTVANNPKHSSLKSAFLWYCGIKKDNGKDVLPITDLINDLLVSAATEKVDVLNCTTAYRGNEFIEECKFAPGDGHLHYYIYNYRAPQIAVNRQSFLIT